MSYTVMVADNYHYQDPEAIRQDRTFDTLEEAIARCKEIVDADLGDKPGESARAMVEAYRMFGDDPFIVGGDTSGTVSFSAWKYAEERARELCGETDRQEQPTG